MTRRFSLATLFMVIAACGGSSTSVDPSGSATPDDGTTDPAAGGPSVGDFAEIDSVLVLQGTTTTLLSGAKQPKKLNAPVVAGRDALVRVHARMTDKNRNAPELAAELHIASSGGAEKGFQDGPK